MLGFFSKEQVQSKDRPDGRSYSCASCGLYKDVLSPRMKPFGNFKKGILNLGEAPGENDDKRGKQWQGKMGRALQRIYKKCGIDLFEDCLNINSVNCRPTNDKGGNRPPTSYEIACCRKKVLRIIDEYKPKIIILHGGAAVDSLIGHRWKKALGGVAKWRGWTIPDRDLKAWVCPTFHPSFVERQDKDSQDVETIWQHDLEQAFSMLDVPFPQFQDEESLIEIVDDKKDIRQLLKKLNAESRTLAVDIETTGLKPYDLANHRIVCTSFCNSPDKAYVVPGPDEMLLRYLKELLENPDIGKIAANMKFEDTWENIVNGIEVKSWIWDTMQAGHVLDNRPGITGLKLQVYTYFGVIDYDSEISSFLEGDKKNANSVNRIMELVNSPEMFHKLKIYCGMDSLFEYRLALIQMEQMGVDAHLEGFLS